ncbi:MAG: DNA polymerase [Cytophagia bacterium]|nr:DNA polymerase [Cytophagia bacterium]
MKYYTNISVQGNNILYRGVNNGRRVNKKIEYSPTLFLPSNKVTPWKTLFGESLESKRFETIRDARDFIKRYDGVENFKIYGNDRYEYAFIADEHRGPIDWDIKELSIVIIDIEVGSENGFPDPYKATEPITAIAVRQLNGGITVYGCGDYEKQGDENYIKCKDEWTLCKTFLKDWQDNYPDVVSGWNIDYFDIPYLVNRFNRILGEDETKKLSPWNNVWERTFVHKGQQKRVYNMTGIAALDYIELYRWYAPAGKSQESYSLNHISSVELDETKLSYDEYDNLHQLYKLNYQKFIEYNIKDVELIVQLEDKLKLIELALTLAYDTKTNYEDVFAQTRMWDSLIYSYLLEKNIVVPPKEIQKKDSAFEGAYVKDPQVGMHNWVASFDLDSLYPHLMMMYNISPETLVERDEYTDEMRKIIMDGVSVENLLAQKVKTNAIKDVTITPNGQFFRTNIQGFLPKMLEEMYEDRKKFKKLMLKCKQEYIDEKDPRKKEEIGKLVARYNNLQLAKKVSLNSAYGALGSQYFRFYDLRMALGVTLAGQLSIRWIENKINLYMNKLLKTNGQDYVIASDTDSIYLRLGGLVDKVYTGSPETSKVISFMDRVCEDKIQPYINESYQELASYVNAYAQKMRMKREGLSNKGFWTAKKRYVLNVFNNEGVQYDEPDMKIMGLEVVKSSTPSIIREKMKETISLIINTDESTVQDFIFNLREEFKKLPVEDISFPRGCNGIREYSDSANLYKKGTPIHVKGAILYNHFLQEKKLTKKYPLIQEGEKLKFTYLKTPNPFKDSVISFPVRLPKEFELQKYIDYETQFDKSFIEPMKIILDCINWKIEKENSIESFFA